MSLVLEGPDNSGKSTLAAFLSRRLGLPVKHSGGPSRYLGEVNFRSSTFNADPTMYIYDRHPCISQNIYAEAIDEGGELVSQVNLKGFYRTKPLIIYCRGRDLDDHRPSEHADAAHIAKVEQVHGKICELYDVWAMAHAHVFYRIGDDMDRIARLASTFDPVSDLERFHQKFGLGYDGGPRWLPDDLLLFRLKFLNEELNEYHHSHVGKNRNLAESLDALVDLVYVALGTSYLHGFNFREAWRRVQAANMKKIRVQRAEDSKRGSTFDVIKPAGWTPPDHSDLVLTE